MLSAGKATIELLGHDSVRIKCGITIYVDPFKLADGSAKADIILITHGHFDHCSLADVRMIATEKTVVLATPDCQSKLPADKVNIKSLQLARPGMKIQLDGATIETVPAYNTDKHFHPKDDEFVGYVVNIGGARIYHAGDTDFIPEMASLKDIDIALLPVSGTYVMTAEEAAKAADTIKPKIAVPMHYAAIVGTKDDAMRFEKLCTCKVIIS